MSTGTIIALRFDRGFGFISPPASAPDGGDVFFHNSALATGSFDELREGDSVEYETEPDPRNPSRNRAVNVRVLSPDRRATS